MIAAATVHAPYLTGWPDRAQKPDLAATMDGFARLSEAYGAAEIDTLVVVTSEHIVNLSPKMAPPFMIGCGDRHPVFPERHFNLPVEDIKGDAAFAKALTRGFYDAGFEPAHSTELVLDHGTIVPLHLMKLAEAVSVIPIVVNSIFAPLPSLARCAQFGRTLGKLIDELGGSRRIGLLATGGLSHSVGTPGVFDVDRDLDRWILESLLAGDVEAVCEIADAELDAAGNGTHEIRNWIVVAAASQPRRPVTITNIPFAEGWNMGVHQLLWEGV